MTEAKRKMAVANVASRIKMPKIIIVFINYLFIHNKSIITLSNSQ